MAHVRIIWVVPSSPLTLQVVASRALDTFSASFAGFERDACSLSVAKTDVGNLGKYAASPKCKDVLNCSSTIVKTHKNHPTKTKT